MKVRKRPVEVEAIRWTGVEKEGGCGVDVFYALGIEHDQLEPDASWSEDYALRIYNVLEGCWVRCPLGYYVIKGVRGEFYPCDPEVFEKTYEVLEEADVDVEEAP